MIKTVILIVYYVRPTERRNLLGHIYYTELTTHKTGKRSVRNRRKITCFMQIKSETWQYLTFKHV
jgi:hypothetical protein